MGRAAGEGGQWSEANSERTFLRATSGALLPASIASFAHFCLRSAVSVFSLSQFAMDAADEAKAASDIAAETAAGSSGAAAADVEDDGAEEEESEEDDEGEMDDVGETEVADEEEEAGEEEGEEEEEEMAPTNAAAGQKMEA